MSEESPEEVAVRVSIALSGEAASDYGSGFIDKEYPEIVWSMYGLPDTNEIAVIAEVGSLQLGMAHVSALLWPAMIDRVFGIDVDDQRLALRLSKELWDAHSERFVAEALRVRRAS
ncbi:hypothetical protein [Nevskia ramosa]|uniref:hypothetical protein n=1 Tax=Nevskia ramosa TaxID=64002 RepID=UPI0025E422C5|nr:hypothetical protein [uncultured Nevskia sp.]|eukprot:TRINITY_DN16452_c0_g1_i1.p3 TRINITY_DN16452_c0_g1~~TRINITY_DN16452_c0_g1_i1.p3  ORF type:complete len:116 (-),score=8.38 TRINITY_DN16452_c0_g1_i1:886-1233(-)